MYKTALPALLAAVLLTAGCQTYQSPTVRTHMTEDRLIEQENQRRMSGRLETLEMEISRISQELDSLRRNLDNRCAAIENKSEEDKREMISRLSSQLEKLIKQAVPAPAPAPAPRNSGGSSGGSGYGYEHIVQQGETLSAIAKAYNVTTKAIIQANKIKNPSLIRVGQTLFIPE